MKIAIVSKSDRLGGGASRVAEDLALGLNELGYKTDHFISYSNKEPYSFQRSLYGEKFAEQICKKTHFLTNKFGFRELLPVEYWFNLRKYISGYDIVHFHDLFSSISPITMSLVSNSKPTFFTVHDYSAFTGGCLYPSGCDKFADQCYQCPQLSQIGWKNQFRDRTKEVQSIKRWVSNKSSVQYIFPSISIAQEAQKSLTYKLPPQVIYHGIDLSIFSSSKSRAKSELNIPEDRQVVVVTAHFLQDARKGVSYAISALQSVRELNPLVLLIGFANEQVRQSLVGLDVREMGFISNPEALAQAYLASDIMLFCSLEEIFGLTVLEAMAASTVVIGFKTGGVPEMIQTEINGILVEQRDQESLNQSLRRMLEYGNLREMGQRARIDVENKFSKSQFLNNHLKAYEAALLKK